MSSTGGDTSSGGISVRTVTGYSESEMETMDPVDLIVEEDRDEVVRAIGKAFKTGHSRVEARIKTKDGEEIPMEFVASTINTPSDGLLIAGSGGTSLSEKAPTAALKSQTSVSNSLRTPHPTTSKSPFG